MNHIDLDLYFCKFYNNDIEIKHTYFLLIPTQKDDTTFRIIFDSNVNPSTEFVKHWANQPQYPHCVVENFIWYKPSVNYQKTTTTHLKETGQSGYNDKESQEKSQQKSQKTYQKTQR